MVTRSLHGSRNPKTEVGTRDWDVAVMGPDHVSVWRHLGFGTLGYESSRMI